MRSSTSDEEHRTRELWVTYRSDPKEPQILLAGVTTDRAMLNLYHGVCKQESDAWLLAALGVLPSWWPMVDSVCIRNLTEYNDDTDHPQANAKKRLAGATEEERAALMLGWRIMKTGSGGRIMRVPQRERKPIVKDPKIHIVLRDMKIRQPVGPFVPYEPRVIVT